MTIAPGLAQRAHDVGVALGAGRRARASRQAVTSPATSVSSLIATGTPSSGRRSPAPRRASAWSASVSARWASTTRKALSSGSACQMRSSDASTSSRAETSPAATRRACSAAPAKQRSVASMARAKTSVPPPWTAAPSPARTPSAAPRSRCCGGCAARGARRASRRGGCGPGWPAWQALCAVAGVVGAVLSVDHPLAGLIVAAARARRSPPRTAAACSRSGAPGPRRTWWPAHASRARSRSSSSPRSTARARPSWAASRRRSSGCRARWR